MENKENKTWGVASLVISIISLIIFFMPYFGLPIAIFSVIAANKQERISSNGVAIAGKIIGIISIVINSCMLLIVLVLAAFYATTI